MTRPVTWETSKWAPGFVEYRGHVPGTGEMVGRINTHFDRPGTFEVSGCGDARDGTVLTDLDDAKALCERDDVYDRVGPGYQTAPAILDAMLALQEAIERAGEALEAANVAMVADHSGANSPDRIGHGVEYGLSAASGAVAHEIRKHREYLASGEPERLAAEDGAVAS